MNSWMDTKEYEKLVKENLPKANTFKNSIYAFIFGGFICDIGQLISKILKDYGLTSETVASFTTLIMIFIGAFLTGIGVYDNIGRVAGAGSIVPITGFANSIVAPAMEYKREGFVFGVGAKMFSVAGPVLVYGISTSVLIGLIYYLLYY